MYRGEKNDPVTVSWWHWKSQVITLAAETLGPIIQMCSCVCLYEADLEVTFVHPVIYFHEIFLMIPRCAICN